MKQNKIKGGIYSGRWWADFTSPKDAKRISHKQERARSKKIYKNA
jgi:hypothetical protein